MSKVLVFNAYGGSENQELIDRPVPTPGPGQLVIEVKAAGVNPSDWKAREGQFGTKRALPSAMGFEASGVVTALGEGVDEFAVGDAVLGPVPLGKGGIAEHAVMKASSTVRKPAGVSFIDAAALPVAGATAYDLTHQVDLEPGQTILIVGAGGGVGIMASQIGAARECTVIGIAGASKRDLVEGVGATFVESGLAAVNGVSGVAPDGVDLIIDLVGGEVLRQFAPLVKHAKNIVSAADAATAEELGGAGVTRTKDGLAQVVDMVERGIVDPQVQQQFSLADACDAVAAVETGHTKGKIVVVP